MKSSYLRIRQVKSKILVTVLDLVKSSLPLPVISSEFAEKPKSVALTLLELVEPLASHRTALYPPPFVELFELVVELPTKKFTLLPAFEVSLRYSERAAIESCVLEVHPVS